MKSIRDLLEKWAEISRDVNIYYLPKEGDETKVHSSYEFPHGTFILRNYEKPNYFSWEFKKKPSMLEKLAEHYEWAQELGIEGHVVGYYNELNEKICDFYVFENGIFKLIKEKNNFYLWLFQR